MDEYSKLPYKFKAVQKEMKSASDANSHVQDSSSYGTDLFGALSHTRIYSNDVMPEVLYATLCKTHTT